MYKIIYSVNCLPIVSLHRDNNGKLHNVEANMMQVLSEDYDYLEVFDTLSLQELIEYKWDVFSFYHHSFNFFMQLGQMCYISWYTVHIYINNALELSQKDLSKG